MPDLVEKGEALPSSRQKEQLIDKLCETVKELSKIDPELGELKIRCFGLGGDVAFRLEIIK